MTVKQTIEAQLTAALTPVALTVIDDSARHAGHAGARPGGETHFKVEIISEKFAGSSKIARHRMVHDALAELLRTQIHALEIRAKTPKKHENLA